MSDSPSTRNADDLEVPLVDDRSYRYWTLPATSTADVVTTDRPGLRVLLVHDDSVDKGAAAVDVAVGQFQDGDLPGLAHLTEHMLFLGTQRFPQENALDSFLAAHGGHSNAYTDLEHTVYYMDVQAAQLEPALDRFGSCFEAPLLLENCVARELQAVDSEHGKNKQSDFWRYHQLTKTLLGQHNSHVYQQFGTGNLESLQPQGTAVLRQAVHDFYQRYYHTARMTLCVLGNQDLDVLQGWVEKYFGSLPSQPSDTLVEPPVPPLTPVLPQRVHVVPTRETNVLELQWCLREIQSLYRSKPTRVLSHLLGHEGPGSLLAVLRERLWVQELYADDSSKTTSAFSIFCVQLELTVLGWEHVNDIVATVYRYIGLLQNEIPAWVADELQTTASTQFRFLSKSSPSDTVSRVAHQMQEFAIAHVLSGPYLVYEHDMAAVQSCLASLHVDNMLVLVASKEYTGQTTATDPWYGTQYATVALEPDALEAWRQARSAATDGSGVDFIGLHLPDRNDMLATDFELKASPYAVFAKTNTNDSNGDNGNVPPPPRCLLDTDTCRLWYKPDTEFRMPKVNIMCVLRSATAYESVTQSVLASLWSETADELCNVFSYAASMAGLHCNFSNTRNGMELHLSGYHDKAHVLLQRIVDTVRDFRVTPDLFERIQSKLEQQFQEFLVAQPYQHAIYAGDLCLETPKWDIHDRLQCLASLTLNDLQHFGRHILARFQLEMLVHGNVTASEAVQLSDIVLLGWRPQAPLNQIDVRVVQLPAQGSEGTSTVHRFSGWNEDDENSSVCNIYQVGTMDTKMNATLGLLHHLIREPAFGQLRTQEQLGYIVHTQVKTSGDKVKSLLFLIQSDSFDPIHMDQRIEAFLVDFRHKLVQMSEPDFAANVGALCQSFLEKNKNLSEESSRYWHVITNQTYRFYRMSELAAAAQTVTKLDVLRFLDRHVLATSPYRRKLSVQVFGQNHIADLLDKTDVAGDGIVLVESANDFRRSQALFPMQASASIEDWRLDAKDD
jgi:insulysin